MRPVKPPLPVGEILPAGTIERFIAPLCRLNVLSGEIGLEGRLIIDGAHRALEFTELALVENVPGIGIQQRSGERGTGPPPGIVEQCLGMHDRGDVGDTLPLDHNDTVTLLIGDRLIQRLDAALIVFPEDRGVVLLKAEVLDDVLLHRLHRKIDTHGIDNAVRQKFGKAVIYFRCCVVFEFRLPIDLVLQPVGEAYGVRPPHIAVPIIG